MKITAQNIINATNALSQHGGLSLPPSISYKVARLTRILRQESELINEQVDTLLKSYAEKDENGVAIIIQTPQGAGYKITKMESFNAAKKSLLSSEVEIEVELISISDLGDKPVHSDLLAGLVFLFKD